MNEGHIWTVLFMKGPLWYEFDSVLIHICITHSNMLITHSNMFTAQANMIIAHSKMLITHSSNLITYSNLLITYSNMLSTHSNMLIIHLYLINTYKGFFEFDSLLIDIYECVQWHIWVMAHGTYSVMAHIHIYEWVMAHIQENGFYGMSSTHYSFICVNVCHDSFIYVNMCNDSFIYENLFHLHKRPFMYVTHKRAFCVRLITHSYMWICAMTHTECGVAS